MSSPFEENEEDLLPTDARVKNLQMSTRTAWIVLGVIGVTVVVLTVGLGIAFWVSGSAYHDVNHLEDDIDDLDDLINGVNVPSFETAFSNLPSHASIPNGIYRYDDDGDRKAVGHFKTAGDVIHLPYFDDDANPRAGVTVDFNEMYAYEGLYAYKHLTANCSNTEIAMEVWSSSGPITTGSVVGSKGGRASDGFNTYEQTLVAAGVENPGTINFFAFGNHSAVFNYINNAGNPVQGIISGTADDQDALSVATGPPGAAVFALPVGLCMTAGAQHSDLVHHLVARVAAPGTGAGGEVDFCLVTSESPYTVTCAATATFAGAEDIAIVGVNHIAGTENFLVTYVSDSTGIQSLVATVDRIGLSVVLTAPTIVDAAFVDLDCYKSEIVQSNNVFTYIYGSDGAIGMTIARYSVTGTTLSLAVAPTVIDPSTSADFQAAAVGTSHFAISVRDNPNNILGELRLYSAIGSVSPSFESRHSYIDSNGPIGFFSFDRSTIDSLGDDAVLVSYVGSEFEQRPVVQVWHLHNTGSGSIMIPGEDQPIAKASAGHPACVALPDGNRALCGFAPFSPSSISFDLKVSKVRAYAGASPLFARSLSNVFSKASIPVGIALNDALPGEVVLVRQAGCFHTPGSVDQFLPESSLCLHGDGTVTPNRHVSEEEGTMWEPVCGNCRSTSPNAYTCSLIVS